MHQNYLIYYFVLALYCTFGEDNMIVVKYRHEKSWLEIELIAYESLIEHRKRKTTTTDHNISKQSKQCKQQPRRLSYSDCQMSVFFKYGGTLAVCGGPLFLLFRRPYYSVASENHGLLSRLLFACSAWGMGVAAQLEIPKTIIISINKEA